MRPADWKPPTQAERQAIVRLLKQLLDAVEEQTKRLDRLRATIQDGIDRYDKQ